MKKTQFIQVFFFVLSFILFGFGGYFYWLHGITIQSTAFLRAGFLFLIPACFIRQILWLPRWTDIGWLPLAAAVISWKPFLLKFALPLSIVLIFLNSPLARGRYRQKSWRNLGKQMKGSIRRKTGSAEDTPDRHDTEVGADSVLEREASKTENIGPEKATADSAAEKAADPCGTEIPAAALEVLTDTASGVKIEILSEEEAEAAKAAETANSEKRRPSSDVRGPNAKNVMFRALSRVAGRQVGKVVHKVKGKN